MALFLSDGRVVEANAEASSAEAAASILTAAAARSLSSSYDALRRGTEDAMARSGATPGLPYVTLNKNSPAPYVSVVQTGVVADTRKPRQSSRRPAARHGNAGKPGWVSGHRPSHSEIWANGKPIVISRAGSQWSLSVMGAPVVRLSDGALSFRGRSGFEEDAPLAKFKKDDAKFLAHKIGHYMLNLGDFVTTYTAGY